MLHLAFMNVVRYDPNLNLLKVHPSFNDPRKREMILKFYKFWYSSNIKAQYFISAIEQGAASIQAYKHNPDFNPKALMIEGDFSVNDHVLQRLVGVENKSEDQEKTLTFFKND